MPNCCGLVSSGEGKREQTWVKCDEDCILFGYHLGVINGTLEYLAKDLCIVENVVLQDAHEYHTRFPRGVEKPSLK
ncbi:hypothetical protein L1987_85915 [Smallanthus sonchifolius]|uniref:Uncharacterized protein n=1 Tax=Smallanthus sonchifolius TaxID=185202 RepID=A0ACB8XZF6_9ASTR|nr:hypothetical protein L1987_85915 [Smallanthus sonchifolius]